MACRFASSTSKATRPPSTIRTRRPLLPPSHATNLQLGQDDVVRTYGAGGSGLGDPLFREPERVAEDLENAMITPDVVGSIYGVVIGEDVFVTVLEVSGQTVRLGIEAPAELPVYREEIWLSVKEENRAAASAAADSLPSDVAPPPDAQGAGGDA